VSSQLKKASILLDSWFTGMDFPSAAVEQIAKAVSRRHLGHSMPVHFFIEPIIYQQDLKFQLYVPEILKHIANSGMVSSCRLKLAELVISLNTARGNLILIKRLWVALSSHNEVGPTE